MESLSDKERMELLGEVFMDELRVIREYVSDIPVIKRRLGLIEDRLDKVEWRLENVEYAVKDHSREIHELKQKLV